MKKSATLQKEGLNFTYNLKKEMKIDLDRLKKKAEENKNQKEENEGKDNYFHLLSFISNRMDS